MKPSNVYSLQRKLPGEASNLASAVQFDYVAAEYLNSDRNVKNFVKSDCLVMDIENDHSDNPREWKTPEDVRSAFPEVAFNVHYSRNHMRQKGDKSTHSKFHVFFPIGQTTSTEQYTAMKHKVAQIFPYFDKNALDAGRFFFGTQNPKVEFFAGNRNLTAFLAEYDEDITLNLSRRFSPEDFITRTEEEKAKILSDKKKFLASFRESEKLGKNILHVIACNQGRYIASRKMIRLLCENGADVNMRSLDGVTPIIMAVKSYHGKRLYSHRNLENLCELIRAGADFDLKDEKGFSFRKFIEDDDDSDSGIIFINTYVFAEKMRMPIFSDILRTVINDENTNDAYLLVASYGTNVKKISDAISGGADIEAKTRKGYTPLMIASMFGTPETVKFLIENGADANIKDRFGNNAVALNVIAGEDNNEIIRVLSEAGVNIDSRNEDDFTPIMQTVADRSKYGAKLEKLKILLSLGADPNLKPIKGECAIKTAAENGMYLAVKELLRAGVSPERLCE